MQLPPMNSGRWEPTDSLRIWTPPKHEGVLIAQGADGVFHLAGVVQRLWKKVDADYNTVAEWRNEPPGTAQ